MNVLLIWSELPEGLEPKAYLLKDLSDGDVNTLKGAHGTFINVNDDPEVNSVGTTCVGKLNLYLDEPAFGNAYSSEELTNFGITQDDVGKWHQFKISTDTPVDISAYDLMVFAGFYC